MQPADAAVSRRMNISWYAAKWRRHALTQISLRQMRGQFTSQVTGEERFDEKEEDTESKYECEDKVRSRNGWPSRISHPPSLAFANDKTSAVTVPSIKPLLFLEQGTNDSFVVKRHRKIRGHLRLESIWSTENTHSTNSHVFQTHVT
ncbi:hypothetical protein M8J77_002432 [Diaphorina citri]|nr:hypothetical protein M8J77_002432 [Diaphorina citri]